MKKLSVIICTYNRSKILKKCVKSLVRNNRDLNEYEILIIDNNSEDDTKEQIEALNIKNLIYIFEPKQGLSNARNRGIKESKMEFVVFIDDDVIVETGFIKNILHYFKDEKNVCGGGKIYSIWETNKPSWFKENFYSIIGETKYGNKNRVLIGNEYPYGGNMFFRKNIFKTENIFNPDLGVKGNEIAMGEEVEVCEKIRREGYELHYLNEVVVGHRVHMDKINQEYVEKRWKEEGQAYGKIISGNGKKSVIKQFILRCGIILLRDYPNYMISKLKRNDNRILHKTQLLRSKIIIKNLKL